MIRNLKALGLALVAVLALGALAASAAQAEFNAQVTTEGAVAGSMDGNQTTVQKFTRGAVPVTCETATFAANASNGDTTITVTPTYTACHATGPFGETWPVTVTMNGCNYLFHLTADFISGNHTYTAIPTVKCPANQKIVLHVYTSAANHTNNNALCTINVGEQNPGGHIHLANAAGAKNKITANVTVTNIVSTREGSALCGPVEHNTGQLHGGAELKGTNGAGAEIGITISTDPPK